MRRRDVLAEAVRQMDALAYVGTRCTYCDVEVRRPPERTAPPHLQACPLMLAKQTLAALNLYGRGT